MEPHGRDRAAIESMIVSSAAAIAAERRPRTHRRSMFTGRSALRCFLAVAMSSTIVQTAVRDLPSKSDRPTDYTGLDSSSGSVAATAEIVALPSGQSDVVAGCALCKIRVDTVATLGSDSALNDQISGVLEWNTKLIVTRSDDPLGRVMAFARSGALIRQFNLGGDRRIHARDVTPAS